MYIPADGSVFQALPNRSEKNKKKQQNFGCSKQQVPLKSAAMYVNTTFALNPRKRKNKTPGKCKSCPQSVFTCSYRSTTCLCSLFVHAAGISAAESADACSQSARLSLLQLGSTLLPAWPNASSCISPSLCSVLISTGAASCSPLSSCGPRGIACRV